MGVFGTQFTAFGLLLGLLIYPLLEECVFRFGLLQWADSRWPAWRGWRTNAAVSLIFAALHLWAWPWLHAVAVFFPSLLFGAIWQRTQKLWLCVAAHSACNAVGYALAIYAPGLLP